MRKTVIPAVAALTLLTTPVPASAKIDNEAVAAIVNSTPTVVEQNTGSGQCRPNVICIWSEINYTGSKMEYMPSSGCIQALTGATRPGARSIINNSKRRMMLFAEPSCPSRLDDRDRAGSEVGREPLSRTSCNNVNDELSLMQHS
jgi:peptidase inhibitor family I36